MNESLPMQTNTAHRDMQLDLLRQELEQASYPGYPEQAKRFSSLTCLLGQLACNCLTIPDGPWTVDTHPNRRDMESVPSDEKQLALLADNYRLDTQGRPLHPWFEHMVHDETLGIVGGKGAYWSWGPNRTADSIVMRGNDVLLVQRSDTGAWAFPGGFIDTSEDPLTAAVRETVEETGVILDASLAQPLYDGPVVDPRMTAHAWPETAAYLFTVPEDDEQQPLAQDDAAAAAWVPIERLNQLQLFGAHRFLADIAMQHAGEASHQLHQQAPSHLVLQ